MDINGFLEKYEYGKYVVLGASRLSTFVDWPYDAAIKGCTSVKLAAAGFVCTMNVKEGTGASAACVFCGKDLEFDETDDPWKEHAKRRPDCEFVKLGKQDETTWTMHDFLQMLAIAHSQKMKTIIENELLQMRQAGMDTLAEIETSIEDDDSSDSMN